MGLSLGSLKKALGGGGIRHNLETIMTGGAATGVRMVEQDKKSKQATKAKRKRGDERAAAAAKKKAAATAMEKRRALLKRKGVRSTRRSRISPLSVAESSGATKKLGS